MSNATNGTVGNDGIDGYYGDASHVYESMDECQKEMNKIVPTKREVSPYQIMSSGFPNVLTGTIKTKQLTPSRSTDSSMNEYIIVQSGQSSSKNENDIIPSTPERLQMTTEDNRVSTITTGEGGGYMYMRSFSTQEAGQMEDGLASESFIQV